MLDELTESKAWDSFDCGKYPNVLLKTGSDIALLTADIDIV